MKYSSGSGPGARVVGLVAEQEGEQAGQEQARARSCSRTGSARAGRPSRAPASPRSRPRRSGTRSGTAPRSSRRAAAIASHPAADAVEQHPDRPDQLEAAASLAPLVEQRDARTRGPGSRSAPGRHDRRGSCRARPVLVGGDQPQEEPIEQARGALVQGGQPSRHRAPAGGPARSARRGTAVGPRRTARRLRSGSCPTPPAGGRGRRPARSPRARSACARRHRSASASRWATSAATSRRPSRRYAFPLGGVVARRQVAGIGRVASPVGACQSLRARAHARQRTAAGTPGPGERVDRAAREASMAARRQVDLDAAFVGPAPERVGIDAEQPAGRSERQPVAIGVGSDGHTGLGLGSGCRRTGRALGERSAGPSTG